MASEAKCPSCQSTHLEAAKFDGMAITLDRATTLKKLWNTAGSVHCKVCMACGALSDFRVDAERIAGMLPS